MHFLASRGYRCIAYDRRGFGRSSQPWTGYNHDVFADDLASLIHALDLIDAVLVGAGMGGGDIARYMMRHGTKRVDKVVLLSTVLPFLRRKAGNPDGADGAPFDAMRAGISADRTRFLLDLPMSLYEAAGGASPVAEGVRHWTFGLAMQAALPAVFDCIAAFSETDFRRDLSAINVPALLVHGGADQFTPVEATARRAAELIATSELTVIDAAPHGLWFTHRDQVNALLLRFIGPGGIT